MSFAMSMALGTLLPFFYDHSILSECQSAYDFVNYYFCSLKYRTNQKRVPFVVVPALLLLKQ